MQANCLKAEARKCMFRAQQGSYLGHIMSSVEIAIDLDKIQAIID